MHDLPTGTSSSSSFACVSQNNWFTHEVFFLIYASPFVYFALSYIRKQHKEGLVQILLIYIINSKERCEWKFCEVLLSFKKYTWTMLLLETKSLHEILCFKIIFHIAFHCQILPNYKLFMCFFVLDNAFLPSARRIQAKCCTFSIFYYNFLLFP